MKIHFVEVLELIDPISLKKQVITKAEIRICEIIHFSVIELMEINNEEIMRVYRFKTYQEALDFIKSLYKLENDDYKYKTYSWDLKESTLEEQTEETQRAINNLIVK